MKHCAVAVRLLPLVAAVAIALGAAPAEAALRVDVQERPFALRLVDEADGDVLALDGLGYSFDLRVPVIGNAYLGYYVAAEVPTVNFGASRVLERRGDEYLLATDDPLGHRIALRITRPADGVVRLESRLASGPLAGTGPTLSLARFDATPDERFLGFGERSNAVDQTGREVFSWAEEGPFSAGNYEALTQRIPSFAFPTGPAGTNFPIPWLVSTRGFGVLIDRTERSRFLLRGSPWTAQVEGRELALEVYAGPQPADSLRRYSARAGRQPNLPPWGFGAWYQPTREATPLELARRFREQDVPVSVAQTYTHYLPCGAHIGRREAERKRVADYHALGYAITTYFNPHVCTAYTQRYQEGVRRGLFVRNALGLPYLLTNPFTADEIVSEIDFTLPAAREWFTQLLDEALEDGYDGWMEDFGEYTPYDSVFANGSSGKVMHNRYPVDYHCTSTAHTTARRGRDFVAFIRSGFHGVQPCARAVWGGDPTEDWSCTDGLCAALHQSLNMGLSGIAYWGTDIGGFHAIVNGRTSDELNIRWLQLGAVSGVMRTQANGFTLRDDLARRSQVWSRAVAPVWRRYAKLRTQLYPYLAGAAADYRETGLPLARQLSLAFPGDARAARSQEELLFGPDLLAAPVIRDGARERRLHVPAGRWIDLWRSVTWDDAAGTIRAGGRPVLVDGGGERTLPAPLEQLPLLARAGTLLPLLPADVDTLADGRGTGAGLVHLADRRRRLRILAWPAGRTGARFYTDGRLRSRLSARAWMLAIRSRARRVYEIEAVLPFRPRRVTLGGRRIARRAWSYRDGVLRARVRARRATLRATQRP